MFDVSEHAAFSCLLLLLMLPILPACSIGDTFTLGSVFNLRMMNFTRDGSNLAVPIL